MHNLKQQAGSALISALFITALTAIIATALIVTQRLLVNQALLVTNTDQMSLLLQGVPLWAEEIMLKNIDLQKIKSLKKSIDGTQLKGMIFAQQGLFNINCLASTANAPRFARLLQIVVPNIKKEQANKIAAAVSDWLLPGGSNDYYVRQKPPYRAPHHLMANVSELRAVRGITAPIYNALKPYITALPDKQLLVDVNYTEAPVLMALDPSLTLSQANQWIICRREHGLFKSTADYTQFCARGLPSNLQNVTVKDNYYIARGQAKRGAQQLTLTTLLQKTKDKNNKPDVNIIWQEMG